jgi:hypothetical protein
VRKIVFQCLFVCFAAVLVFADQVSLKNGDRLSGTIVKSDGKVLVVHTDYAGDVILKLDAVQGIRLASRSMSSYRMEGRRSGPSQALMTRSRLPPLAAEQSRLWLRV